LEKVLSIYKNKRKYKGGKVSKYYCIVKICTFGSEKLKLINFLAMKICTFNETNENEFFINFFHKFNVLTQGKPLTEF
jgi:hypothetical protein